MVKLNLQDLEKHPQECTLDDKVNHLKEERLKNLLKAPKLNPRKREFTDVELLELTSLDTGSDNENELLTEKIPQITNIRYDDKINDALPNLYLINPESKKMSKTQNIIINKLLTVNQNLKKKLITEEAFKSKNVSKDKKECNNKVKNSYFLKKQCVYDSNNINSVANLKILSKLNYHRLFISINCNSI